jgi:hypothetical protein
MNITVVAALLLPMLCVIGVGYLDCNTAALAIVLLMMQEGFNAAAASGYSLTRLDIAPQYVISHYYQPVSSYTSDTVCIAHGFST